MKPSLTRTQRRQATEIRRRAIAAGAACNLIDRFAAARKQAHALGLPWVENDGTITRPGMTR